MKKYLIPIFLAGMVILNIAVKSAPLSPSQPLAFSLSTWSAKLHPQGLSVFGTDHSNGQEYLLGRGLEEQFSDPEILEKSDQSLTLSYPSQHLKVIVKAIKNRLHFTFESLVEQKLNWPVLGEEPKAQAVIYPDGEGLYVPLEDKFWHKRLNKTSLSMRCDGLTAPFWGYDLGQNTLSIIAHDDLFNELSFFVENEKLHNTFSHDFRSLDSLAPFEMSFSLTAADPLAPAKNYKLYLIESGHYKTLQEKIKENPEIQKLIGAIHAYIWGDGRTVAGLEKLASLGIKRMWIGYENKPPHPYRDKWVKKQYYVDEIFIRKAKSLGYLVGPYDSFHTMQHPDQSDCANDVFDDLYPNGCIYTKDGKPDKGFAGRGCHLSSEALVLQTPANKTILKRIDAFLKTGINSYFLDCDATGELFDDYSKDHPMTQSKDRENRIKRMQYIAQDKNMVLGSETAAAWAMPFIAFSHGNFSVQNKLHFIFVKNKAYGTWWPPERPKFFFHSTIASPEYIQARYDPRYRLPLLQAVFHESVIMTDRWEISHIKLINLIKRREILELFYGVPSIWALDLKDLKNHGPHLKKLSDFFYRLHQEIALSPLVEFNWLTKDRLVQQIAYGDAAILTANFSSQPFEGIPPESLQVKWLKKGTTEIYEVPRP